MYANWPAGTLIDPTSSEFAAKLVAARLSQQDFRILITRLSGKTLSPTTTSRWVAGVAAAPPCALGLLTLVTLLSPARLAELLEELPPSS